ncbi:hypothetical protein DCAR_0313899 [Daucus carota subsp. sativus]|uniref:Uncharacterized protein n=1 Tax=Daucus carota subsp. sativus TaxID=79200 RepID=A0A166CAG3_DAUCS|nr:PREDICTED: uncharacterized protein LOC108213172 [Daucus carota subsp. sativus]WOG94603.1 hypothetical protein DCAR_0313899 [Daucus carota subsp. sativus]
MGNSLRCCLACVLPCGALDLIRIVHLNGHVEEITRPVTAGEILSNNPNHVLSKPCSQGVVRRILILSPETELKRGSIYFLIPSSSLPEKKRNHKNPKTSSKKPKSINSIDVVVLPDPCQKIVTSEKKASRRDRRSCSKSGQWLPQLESIHED